MFLVLFILLKNCFKLDQFSAIFKLNFFKCRCVVKNRVSSKKDYPIFIKLEFRLVL